MLESRAKITGLDFFLGKRPKHVPPGMWVALSRVRFQGKIAAIILLSLLLINILALAEVLALIGIPGWLSSYAHRGLMPTAFVFLVWLACVPPIATKRFLRSVIRDDYCLCITCGYTLLGLPSESRCPECGSQYQYSTLRSTWKSVCETFRVVS